MLFINLATFFILVCHQVYPSTSFLSILFCLVIHEPRHILHTTPATRYTPTHLFYLFYFVLFFHHLLHILHTTPATRYIPTQLFYLFYFILLFINLAIFFILLLPLGIPQRICSIYFNLSCFSSSSPHASYQSCHQVYPNTSFLSILFCLVIHQPRHILQNTPATRYIPTHLFYQFYFVLLFINLATFFILVCHQVYPSTSFLSILFCLVFSSSSPHYSNYSCHQIYPNTSFLSILFCLVIHQPRHILHTSLPLGISQHIFSINFILSCYSSTSPHSSNYSCHQIYPNTSFLSILFCLVIHEPRHILHTTPATRYTPTHLFYLFYFVLFFHHPLHILHTTPATRYIPTQLFYLFYFILLFINLAIYFILLLPLGIPQRICSIYFNLSCFSSSSPHSSNYSCHQIYPNTSFLSILFCLVIHEPRHILHTTPATRYTPTHLFYLFYFVLFFHHPLHILQTTPATRYIPTHLFYQFYFVLLFINLATFFILVCHQVYPSTSFLSILFCLVILQPRHILQTTPATRYIPTHIFYQFYFVLLFMNLATFFILLLPLGIPQHIFSIYFILSCFFIILSTFFILLLPLGISQHNFSICFILSCYSSTSLYSSYQSCHQVYPNTSFLSIFFVLLFIKLATFCIILLPLGISQHIFSINFILSCYSSTSPHSSYQSCHQVYPITSFLPILFCLVIHQPRHILHTTPATRFIPSHLFYQFYFVLLFINLATFCILLLPLGLSHHIFSINFILSCYSPFSPRSSYYSCHQIYPNTSFLSILFCLVIHHPLHILHTTPATRYIPTQLFFLFFFLSCYSSTSPHSSYYSCHQV